MEVSNKAKERFCKDCNIPIRLFQEPYFSDRIKLFDKFYGTVKKWNKFVTELQKYNCEQDYFEEYNRVKDAAINSIKESESYQKFNSEDMNKFAITHKDLSSKDIFKPTNDEKIFISIDMRKANFSSLHSYDKGMFGNADTWEQFISRFTDNEHIINSKYIRQVILGNCNPKRHITYEKYLMDQTLYLNQYTHKRIGGDCLLEGKVFNLITKERYFHKPTIITMRLALEKMKQICLENDIKKIAMPVIGCGLDRLNWTDVSEQIKSIFTDTDVDILVCKR